MQTLKEQIKAIRGVIKDRERTEFAIDGNKADRERHKRVENNFTDTLRDAATTLIALDLITSDRQKFLADFATKLNARGIGLGMRLHVVAELETFLVEKGLLPPIDRPRDNSDCINDAVRYSNYGLRCFNCNGTGKTYVVTKLGGKRKLPCSSCFGTGVPREGNAGYGFVDTKTTPGLKRPHDNGQAAVQASNVAEVIRLMKGPYRPGEIEKLKLVSVETLKKPRPIKRCVYCGRTNYRHVDKSCPGYGNPDKAYRDLPYRTWPALPSELPTPEKFKRKRHGKNRN